MDTTTWRLRRSLACATLAIFCATVSLSAAAIPSGPLGCSSVFGVGGCAPYSQVIFETGSTHGSLFEYAPVVLDYSATGTTANVRGVVDLASGQLKAFAQGIEDGNPSTGTGGFIIAQAADVFTLHGLSSGLVSFSVVLTAGGMGVIANNSYSGQAMVNLGVPGGGGGDFDLAVYQAGNNAPLGTPFSLLSTRQDRLGNQLRASNTYALPLDIPFELDYFLRADVSQGVTFDLSHTGQLNFILPAGVSVTSMGGYSAGGITPSVPEPSTWLLLGAGLLCLGARAADNNSRARLKISRPEL